jgi:hypothetical protein
VVPLLVATGAGAEMRRPLGTTVFAGMIGVTLLGIFLTPVFFVVIDRLAAAPLFASPGVRRAAALPFALLPWRLPWVRPVLARVVEGWLADRPGAAPRRRWASVRFVASLPGRLSRLVGGVAVKPRPAEKMPGNNGAKPEAPKLNGQPAGNSPEDGQDPVASGEKARG